MRFLLQKVKMSADRIVPINGMQSEINLMILKVADIINTLSTITFTTSKFNEVIPGNEVKLNRAGQTPAQPKSKEQNLAEFNVMEGWILGKSRSSLLHRCNDLKQCADFLQDDIEKTSLSQSNRNKLYHVVEEAKAVHERATQFVHNLDNFRRMVEDEQNYINVVDEIDDLWK